jgi:orotidine-5'-phosphate decarboxylase
MKMIARGDLSAKDRLIVALDVPDLEAARSAMQLLKDDVGMFKIGLELFTACGVVLFDLARELGVRVFFDTKFHDIPNTVAQASGAATRHGVNMFNLHALGGRAMMEAAARAVCDSVKDAHLRPALIAVTILTSTSQDQLRADLCIDDPPLEQMVLHLARMACDSGMDGVVASAREAKAIRAAMADHDQFLIVTPGIRPAWSVANDQVRIVTPADAIADGADYLVVGRPIMAAADKKSAARRIVDEMEQALVTQK